MGWKKEQRGIRRWEPPRGWRMKREPLGRDYRLFGPASKTSSQRQRDGRTGLRGRDDAGIFRRARAILQRGVIPIERVDDARRQTQVARELVATIDVQRGAAALIGTTVVAERRQGV